MRVLVTTNAAVGHFRPLVPTILALLAAGHDVRVGCPSSFAETVSEAGLEPLACEERPVDADVPPLPRETDPGVRLRWAVTLGWPWDARSWVVDLLARAHAWQPEVVIVEPVEHAGRVTAAALRVPLVEHGWGFTLPAGMTDAGSRGVTDLYELAGAVPVRPKLRIDVGAQSLQPADSLRIDRYRYVPLSQPGPALPEPDGRPRVLATLGTYGHPDAAQTIRVLVGAAHDCGAQVIVALGNPDRALGQRFPPGTIVRDWVDLPTALASCDLAIHHGGAGTSWSVLTAGRAALVTPQAADQFRHADLLARAGVATTIEPAALSASVARDAIEHLLSVPDYAARAERVAAENLALPDMQQLVPRLLSLTDANGGAQGGPRYRGSGISGRPWGIST